MASQATSAKVDKTVIIRNDEDVVNSGEPKLCAICGKVKSKYTCPRCNLRYCSSACYKGKGHLQCSETFYKECFMEGLKDHQISGEDRQEMLAMLSRLEEENPLDSDDDDEIDLSERLEGLNLDKDTDAIWERLTDKERSEFKTMLQDGRLGSEVQVWTPWWTKKKTNLVEDMEESTSHEGHSIPGVLSNLPIIHDQPSESIKYSVINVLYGYVYITRTHNGEHLNNCLQATQELLEITDGVGSEQINTAQEAIQCSICKIQQNKVLFQTQEFCVAAIRDVTTIIEGPGNKQNVKHVMSALSDSHKLVSMARKLVIKEKKETPADSPVADELKQLKKKYFHVVKKLEFLLSWTSKCGCQLVTCLPDIDMEFCSLSSDLATHKTTKGKIEQSLPKLRPRNSHKLIEDITDR